MARTTSAATASTTASIEPATTTPPVSFSSTPTILDLLDPKALTDMTAYECYKGEDGGLYGGGINVTPPAHYKAALAELSKIQPLDASGRRASDGTVGLVSIGMSNTTMEFSVFKTLADKDPFKSPFLKIVDGAQGGQTAKAWAEQQNPWDVLAKRLQFAGVAPAQV
jgi:hypothetical protein